MNSVQFWAPYWTSVLLKSSLLIICLSVRLPVWHFSKEESLVFSDFFHNGRYLSNIYHWENFFQKKLIFAQIWEICSNPLLTKFWFSKYGPKYRWPMRLQDPLRNDILRKNWMIKFIFGTQINIKVFYKLRV